jgi:hypothetical protein
MFKSEAGHILSAGIASHGRSVCIFEARMLNKSHAFLFGQDKQLFLLLNAQLRNLLSGNPELVIHAVAHQLSKFLPGLWV